MPKTKSHSNVVINFLSEAQAALIIIVLNCMMFWYVYHSALPKPPVQDLILYPGNLLRGYLWTILTSGFMHRDLMHLFFNMLGILVFGRIVERQLGVAKTFYVYFGALFISMLCATMAYMMLGRNVALIGASGALMGLISAAMLLDPFTITYEMIIPLPVMLKAWLFFYADFRGVLSRVNDGVSHFAHIFGFLSISVLMYWLSVKERKKMTVGLIINIASFFALFLIRKWIYSYL
ncbi:MAG: rhomboid family intramembrane serine protease [Candidatus Omnitrophica bacterium]|nr:rhomboid family intramembrane serine protease [Candidatus Omnitrophota bacterium]